jgi:hypothetical protein
MDLGRDHCNSESLFPDLIDKARRGDFSEDDKLKVWFIRMSISEIKVNNINYQGVGIFPSMQR